MSVLELKSRDLREILIFCLHSNKTAVETHPKLSSTYVRLLLVKERVVSGFNASRAFRIPI